MAAPATSISERKPRVFEPRTISWPAVTKQAIADWLDKHIQSRTKRLKNLHEHKVPEWRRITDGTPREENKSWPFPNCSNLVHQLVGESCDDLAARVLQLIWLTSPIVLFKYLMRAKDDAQAEEFRTKELLLNIFIDCMSYDPRELDLYPRENKWFSDSASLGKSWLVIAPEHREEAVYVGYEPGPKRAAFDKKILYEGPAVVNERYENILNDPDCDVFEKQDPIIRRLTLNKRQLQERAYKGFYLDAEVKKLLDRPDRYGPNEVRRRENSKKGIADSEDTTLAEWDIYECYFSWFHQDIKFRLIAWYHLREKVMLNCVYNFVPDNQVPIVETRLSQDGRGFAQILKDNQDEVSTAKNQRNDAMTWAILGINTINPQNKNIDRNMKLWPGVMLPASKDDFQHTEVGNPAMHAASLANENAMIQQARERAGIAPAVAGAGAGSTSKKGQYSAMGTLAVMQDSNTRSAHRQSDFRHSHVKALALITEFYGFLGLGRKGELFGIEEKKLTEVLKDVLERRIRIPMRAATASMNKEVTKQNEILLGQFINGYIKDTSQRIQAASNVTADAGYRKWLVKIIKTQTALMQQIVKDFQLTDHPEEFIPNPPDIKIEEPNAQTQGAPSWGVPPQLAKVAELIRQRGGGGAPAGGGGGVPPALAGPQGQGG